MSSENTLDSIEHKLDLSNEDSNKVKELLKIATDFPKRDTFSRLSFAKKALLLAEKLNWESGIVIASLKVGEFYSVNDDLKQLPYLRNAGTIALSIKDSVNAAESYNLLANVFQMRNNYDSALYYNKLCYNLRTDPHLKLPIVANVGIIYDNIGDYPRALENFIQALKLNESILIHDKNATRDDSLTNAGLLYSIGGIYVEMSQYDKAFENYTKVGQLSKLMKDSTFEMMSLMGIGKTYFLKGNNSVAAEYYENALKLSVIIPDERNQSDILKDLGNVYLTMGNSDKALHNVSIAKELALKHDYDNLSKIYTILGKIYNERKMYTDAISYLKRAIESSKNLGVLSDQRDAWQVLSTVYENMNKPTEAFNAFKNYIGLRDSVYNVDKARQMTTTDMQYKFDSKQLADSLKQSVAFDLKLQKQKLFTVVGFLGLLMALALSFFILRSYYRQKKNNAIISRAHETIKREKTVSEELLLNILPIDVADELKSKGKVQAKLFDKVSVLFTDFVNFSSTSERISPEALVAELDTCFKAFDEITMKYKIEKIKTVGDAYLAVSGLPIVDSNHAIQIVKAAIEMRDFMIERKKKLKADTFEIRLGIHTGKVIAGIVGVKKFSYDIWGDTVNIAARMEQYSEPGKINISQQTYELIKNQYPCTYRGEIDAKNKGKLEMYFLDA